MFISARFITAVDVWIDSHVTADYPAYSTANDLRRLVKIATEVGEVFEEFAQLTGANSRKPQDMGAYDRMLAELADVALASIMAIQHFTKDEDVTQLVIDKAVSKVASRVAQPRSGKVE
jgi:NTP pyrophosphatase (non-canonical NTP hydrolase)